PDGLAMSSRNKYLTNDQRTDACLLYKALIECEKMVSNGQRNTNTIRTIMLDVLGRSKNITPQYISFVDCQTLKNIEVIESKALVAIAANLGKTRLIDNIIVDAGI
ncbi:MAG: pantoate--beta-alanine ligase, partial [Anaerohalosphaera sp.]|nr:pantoate--beta-alanine ligase [Anaerohalosphaera sp.]